MKVAVTIAVYNEEKLVGSCIESLLKQSYPPDEIIIVDDGSSDMSGEIIKEYASKNSIIRYIYQKNQGPAKARNRAWRASRSDICVFTDGDCIAEADWIKKLIEPLSDQRVGATAGTYKTLNDYNLIAKFVGEEIAWKYKNVRGEIDAHGTYNLAVRKSILEEVGGMSEVYKDPSGEDWDMTYKISRKYKIIFVPEAIVATEHPDKFRAYMKNQVMRGFDRIRLYNEHPDKISSDIYTNKFVKYQVIAALLFLPSCIFILPLFSFSFLIPLGVFIFMFLVSLLPFRYFLKRDVKLALFSIPIIILRNFAWALGMMKGVFKFGFWNILKGFFRFR